MATNLDTLFKTKKSSEIDGVDLKFDNGVSFRIRRFGGGNAHKVKQAMNKHYRPVAKLVESGAISSDQDHEIMVKAFVEASLVSWKGVERDGVALDFNEQNAILLFIELPELFRVIFEYASSVDTFREDLGNC